MRLCVMLVAAFSLCAQDKEAALGAAMARDLRARTGEIDSGVVREYVAALAQRLGGGQYQIAVVSQFAYEPTVFPGGYIFIPSSLIGNARSEGEFAGMLAHSLAHARQKPAPPVFASADDSLLQRALVPVQQRAEEEADVAAVRSMASAGFDPEELVRYVSRVGLSPRARRVAAMENAIAQLGTATYSSALGYERFRDEVLRLVKKK